MSNPIPLSEVPEDIGRNDPCPCGSGRKYKKCCQRVHRMQREAEKRSKSVEDLIEESTNAWDVYQLLRQIHDNNMFALFYDATHDQSPFQERYASKTEFIGAADSGEANLPASSSDNLRRIRLDGPNTYILLTSGMDDPSAASFGYTVVVLRDNELDADGQARQVDHPGPRVWDVQRHERSKAELDDGDLSLADLGYEWGQE